MTKISFLLKCSLFAIVISYSMCESSVLYDKDEDQVQNPLAQALTVLNAISKINEYKGRAMTSLPDPVHALAELTLLGAFKVVFLLISGLFLLSGIFPSMLAGFGISGPFLVRSIAENVGELKNLNYEMVARSIRALPENTFQALDVKGDDCRARAVCEVGEYSASIFPTVSGYVRTFGNKFNLSDKYLVAIVKGMSKANCAHTFRSCPQSPFKKISYLSTYNIF